MDKTVVVIGGGLGGLFTGAILSKEGLNVTVVEKNKTLGGGLQMFKRYGVEFETGMHTLGGFRSGGSVLRICDYLGITDKMHIRDVDHSCMDEINYLYNGSTLKIPEGREAFADYFSTLFPTENRGVTAYVKKMYDLSQEVDLFYLRRGTYQLFAHSDDFMISADELISKYVNDSFLRDVLAYMNPMYGGVKGHTPAYVHSLINVLYINGPSRFEGGSLQMAEALANVVIQSGGQVISGDPAVEITVEGGVAQAVLTQQGKRYAADYVVSAVHPVEMSKMIHGKALSKPYKRRLEEIPNSYSSFTVYVTFKKSRFPYINHTCYLQSEHDQVWQLSTFDNDWPRGFMYMTPCGRSQGMWADNMIINCVMKYDEVRRWEHTFSGRRGNEYEDWKNSLIERVLKKMQQLYPRFSDCIDHVFASSPLTLRDYYSTKEGSLYGYRKDCKNIFLAQVPVYTKVRNLFLTGQNVNLHGICGVPLTAINTAEAILGNSYVLDKINQL